MAIFNSYVKLPEGTIYSSTMDPMGSGIQFPSIPQVFVPVVCRGMYQKYQHQHGFETRNTDTLCGPIGTPVLTESIHN